jgi:two-component sensor histidine kinase/PAS domain-containing protein
MMTGRAMPDEKVWSLAECILGAIRQPLLVLEHDLTVRCANRAFHATFALDPSATTGRSIHEIGGRGWDIPALRELLLDALAASSSERELEVERHDPRLGQRIVLFRAQALPRPRDRPPLVFLSIEDVTEQRQISRLLQLQSELAEKVVDTVREPLLVLHEDMTVQRANAAFYATFGGGPEDTLGRMVHELHDGQWDIPALRRLLLEVLPKDDILENFKIEHDFAGIGRRTMLLNARRIDHLRLILLAFEDITERRWAEHNRELVIGELNHRMKNLFAVVRALATQSDAGRPAEEYRQALLGRLDALSRAHDLLFETDWRGADLRSLAGALGAFACERAEAIDLSGEPVELEARQALSVSLVLHELATNALKYGALAQPDGRVRLAWQVEPEAGGAQLRLVWEEWGGPPVALPDKSGFGTELIRRAFGFELGGAAELSFQPPGFRLQASFPLAIVRAHGTDSCKPLTPSR